MSKVKYAAASPYIATSQNFWRIENYVHRKIAPSVQDKTITLGSKYQYRPDSLSFDLYGTPEYWWVFMVRNMDQIRDPIWDQVAGMTIIAPSLVAIQQATPEP